MIFSLTGYLCNLLIVREYKCQYTKKGEADMAYRKERERGLTDNENQFMPGYYRHNVRRLSQLAHRDADGGFV